MWKSKLKNTKYLKKKKAFSSILVLSILLPNFCERSLVIKTNSNIEDDLKKKSSFNNLEKRK